MPPQGFWATTSETNQLLLLMYVAFPRNQQGDRKGLGSSGTCLLQASHRLAGMGLDLSADLDLQKESVSGVIGQMVNHSQIKESTHRPRKTIERVTINLSAENLCGVM